MKKEHLKYLKENIETCKAHWKHWKHLRNKERIGGREEEEHNSAAMEFLSMRRAEACTSSGSIASIHQKNIGNIENISSKIENSRGDGIPWYVTRNSPKHFLVRFIQSLVSELDVDNLQHIKTSWRPAIPFHTKLGIHPIHPKLGINPSKSAQIQNSSGLQPP